MNNPGRQDSPGPDAPGSQPASRWAGLRAGRLGSFLMRRLPARLTKPLRAYRRRQLLARYPAELAELRSIIAAHPPGKPMVVFPPSLDWSKSLFQRPQHLAIALAQQGALVCYVQPPENITRIGMEWLQDNLLLCSLPVELLADFPQAYVYILTWNANFARLFEAPRLVYDVVDDFSAFPGDPDRLQRAHQQLLGQAELVLATAARLFEQVQAARPDVLLCPNGVEYDRFAPLCQQQEQPTPPPDMLPILQQAQPVVGYYGALAHWFDYDLLQDAADLRPDLSFVLIGPDHDASLPPALLERPNVRWLGAKPYDRLTAYLACFDVATIPFRLNSITHATSPLKLFEYMAACKPTVITPMQESQRYPGVLVASTPQEFSARIDEALVLGQDVKYRETIQQVARENTWEARARQILQALAERQPAGPQRYAKPSS